MNQLINIAIEEAKKSEFAYTNGSKFHLGAVVLKNKRIIGKGCNQKLTNNISKVFGYKNGLHAELLALFRARFEGDTIIVVRLLKNNNLSMSFPCKRCFDLIKKSGIKTVIFSDWEGNIQKIKI